MTKYSYDQKCADLAAHFLSNRNDPELVKSLAQTIQDAIEEWFHAGEPK